jgi:GNAT superfamily N-acetyltransferase
MTVIRSPIFLFNVERGVAEPAELWDAITDTQLADWEGEWMPELFKAMQKLRRAGVDLRFWPQSRRWNWRNKADALNGLLGSTGLSVVCQGVTQGMMFVDTVMKRCRIDGQKGKDLVYVEFLENAPWNRKELLFDPPRYRGVGTVLIAAAIELSKSEGFKGRIGLHSLPQANGFYANTCGMTDLGPDARYQDLRYFELTPEQAEAFIRKGSHP